jgi:transmembrane sensor
MKKDEDIEEKIVSYLTGESAVEAEQVIHDNKNFRELDQPWELAGTAYSYCNSNPDKAWAKLSAKMGPAVGVAPPRRFRLLRYAAIFFALATIGSLSYLLINQPKGGLVQHSVALPKMKIIQTGSNPAEPSIVVLPDGSTVKLNASSTLQYPEQFAASDRRVELIGEAFFEVRHESAHPFIVEVNNVQIEDLGTSFNISAYPGHEKVEVNVASGSVRFTNTAKNEAAVLYAGSRGKYLKQSGTIEVVNELSVNYLSWITKELSFHHTPLASVFEQLENIYHVKVVYADPKIANIPYTANFDKFQLGDIVNVIARTHHLSVIKNTDGYVFAIK